MTRPDLDAIRARASGTAASPHRQGRRDVPRNEDALTLLAYIDELERRLKEIGAQVDELREQYDSVLEANVQAMDGRLWRCCK